MRKNKIISIFLVAVVVLLFVILPTDTFASSDNISAEVPNLCVHHTVHTDGSNTDKYTISLPYGYVPTEQYQLNIRLLSQTSNNGSSRKILCPFALSAMIATNLFHKHRFFE